MRLDALLNLGVRNGKYVVYEIREPRVFIAIALLHGALLSDSDCLLSWLISNSSHGIYPFCFTKPDKARSVGSHMQLRYRMK